jgi:hypothetical protein
MTEDVPPGRLYPRLYSSPLRHIRHFLSGIYLGFFQMDTWHKHAGMTKGGNGSPLTTWGMTDKNGLAAFQRVRVPLQLSLASRRLI